MRVLFDEQAFILNREGGIRRYFSELILALQSHTQVDARPSFRFALSGEQAVPAGVLSLPGPGRLARRFAFAANSPYRRRENEGTLIHRTYYHPRFVHRQPQTPVVYSVFDFIPERFPESFPGGTPHLAKREALQRAAGLICISEFAKAELLSLHPRIDVPIAVTPLGVSDKWFTGVSEPKSDSSNPFFLFVGRRSGYKDFSVAAEAFAHSGLMEHLLIVAGGGKLSPAEWQTLAGLGIQDRVIQVNPSDEQLKELYAEADAFVFPSRMEGFGLPTLESLAAGSPCVILADTSISKEVGGRAVKYFPAGSADALSQLLLDAAGLSKIMRCNRADHGRRHALSFSWQHTAVQAEMAYQRFAGHAE